MLRCISSLCFSGPLEDKIIAAAEAGYDAIEVFREDIVGFEGRPEDIRTLADQQGIAIAALQSLRDFEALPEADRAVAIKRAGRFLDLAERIGAPMLIVCANTRPETLDDPARAATDLALLADMAAARGLRVGYEALASSARVRTHADAWAIVAEANRPNLGLVIGAVHSFAMDSDLGLLTRIDATRIFMVHLADTPTTRIDTQLLTNAFRLFPGQGNLPVARLYDALLRQGYDGPMSMEIFNEQIRALQPALIARDGLRAFQLLDAARDEQSPPHSAVHSVAFIEFAAQATEAEDLIALLRALGFERCEQSDDGMIAVYRQGGITLIVNQAETGLAHAFYLVQGLSVSAIGLRVDDRSVIDRRIAALHEDEGPVPAAAGGYDLPILRGPGGSVFYLLDRPLEDTDFYHAAFRKLADAAPRAALARIDHFAQALQPNLFLSGLLFYRATFDFRSVEQRDVLDPHGTVHSRTLTNDTGQVRISLNSSFGAGTMTQRFLEKSGFAPYHHVAFHSPDLLAAAATIAPEWVLPVPPNYYDDLMLRFDLDPAFLDRLRALNVLYDRDAQGEYLQLYTRQINGFFFEIVQRDGYAGMGAANAPVRMLAQSRDYEAAHALDMF